MSRPSGLGDDASRASIGIDLSAELVRSSNATQRSRSVVALRHGRRDFVLRRLLAIADAVGVLLALALSQLAADRPDVAEFLLWGAFTAPVWVVLFKVYGLYDRGLRRVSHTTLDDAPWLFHALVIGTLLLWLYYKALPPKQLAMSETLVFGAAALASILLLRSLVKVVVIRVRGPERALLIGQDEVTRTLVRKLRAHPEYGLDPVGLVARSGSSSLQHELPVVGELDRLDLPEVVERHRIDRVLMSHTDLDEEALLNLLWECRTLSLKISLLPELFDAMGPSVVVDDVEGVTILGLHPPVLSRSSRAMKRALDVSMSAATLALAVPLLALIALAIKLDSSGAVLFRQQRIGKGGRRFTLYKFRTMCEDAELQIEDLAAHSQDPHWLKLDGDPRVTRVGRLLRLSSLDELPQLWNVVKGEMSLVGPRPLIESEDLQVGGWARSRLDLTPGITGFWQVLGRTNIPFEEMVKLDYLYVTNWSLWTDVRLIMRTLPAVLKRRGAN